MARLLVALGGNALLRRGERPTAENQRANVKRAAAGLAPLALAHELIVTHGNGPQIGLLALQDLAYSEDGVFPLDVLNAQTDGMIGYMVEQELGNLLPFEKPLATVLSMVEVDPDDPAFAEAHEADRPRVHARERGAASRRRTGGRSPSDGDGWRRVVPSPRPLRIFQTRPVRWLLEKGCVVICTGGGGIPTMYGPGGKLRGAEAVVDKDRASALMARELSCDVFVMATDADAVYLDWGKPTQRAIRRAHPRALDPSLFPVGSMGPKVESAIEFVERTGKVAAIGALTDVERIVRGEAGTLVTLEAEGLEIASLDEIGDREADLGAIIIRYMCVQRRVVLDARELLGVAEDQLDRVAAPGREAEPEAGQHPAVAGQDRAAPRSDHAPSGMRSHGRTKNGAIIRAARSTPKRTGSVRHPAASSPFMSEKSLVEDGADEEQEEDRADEPRLDVEDRRDHRPAGDLEQAPARDRDREVREERVGLRAPERGRAVDEREDHPEQEDEEALVRESGARELLGAASPRARSTTSHVGTTATT